MRILKKLLESKSFTSARDLDEFEEKPDDKQNEVRLNCEPMVGMVEKEGKIFLNSVRFSKAWNSLGKDIPIKQGNAFPLGQGDVLDIDTGVWASFPDNTIGVLMMLPSFIGDTGLTLVGSPFVSSNNWNIMIRVTNVRKDMAIKEYHKGNIDLKVKRGKSLRDAAVMGIMKWKLYEELKSRYPNVSMTFGYITKYNRIKYGIEKYHISDAFVISKNFNALRLEYHYKVRLVRRHNRQIHKQKVLKGGAKKPNQSPFEVFGFRLFDRVMFEGNYYFIFGRRKSGSFNIRDINGGNQRNVTYKKLKLSIGKRFMIQKEMN